MPVPVQIFYGSLPEAPANAFLRRRDATHLYIQVQFMRSGRLSRLLSLIRFVYAAWPYRAGGVLICRKAI